VFPPSERPFPGHGARPEVLTAIGFPRCPAGTLRGPNDVTYGDTQLASRCMATSIDAECDGTQAVTPGSLEKQTPGRSVAMAAPGHTPGSEARPPNAGALIRRAIAGSRRKLSR